MTDYQALIDIFASELDSELDLLDKKDIIFLVTSEIITEQMLKKLQSVKHLGLKCRYFSGYTLVFLIEKKYGISFIMQVLEKEKIDFECFKKESTTELIKVFERNRNI